MICPKCSKEFLSADKFCPYCGEPIEAIETEPKAEAENTEETPEVAENVETEETEVTEETEATEEVVAPVEQQEGEGEEETEELTEEEMAAIIADAKKAEKKSNAAVVVLAVLVAITAVIAAFFLGGKLLGGAPGETTAETTVAVDETADVTGEVTGEVTTAPGAIPFEDEIPDDYTLAYPDGFSYKGIDIADYVILGTYKGQTATVENSEEFADEEFENYIKYFLLQYATLGDPVTNRPAALYDSVVIDYAGTIDGVAFSGGTASDQAVVLGKGQFIPGFEEGIIGMNIGETKDIPVTFPENYGVDTLNGKQAIFKITLKSVTENILPEYNDEFVKTNLQMENVAEFEANLRDMKAQDALSEKYAAILEIISDAAVMKQYPKGAVEDYIYQQVSNDKLYATSYYGISVEEYINGYYGVTVPQYEAQVRAMAENMIKQEFALYAVAQAEGLTVTDEDIALEIGNYLEHYEATDVAALCSTLGVSEELLNNSIHFSVVYNKVMNLMMENTTFNVAQ